MKNKAFSLIEIVIAIAILALILGGMTAIFSQGYLYLRKVRYKTIALALLQEKLEEESHWPPTSSSEGYGSISGYADFRREVTVSDYLYPGQLKKVTVSVWWDSDKNSKSISTLVGNY